MAPKRNDSWKFWPRYTIRGILHTKTPFFTGSGHTIPHPEIKKDERPVEVMAFPRAGDTPFIPGSTIKGALRAWAEKYLGEHGLLEEVFGKGPDEDGDDQGLSGTASFMDALLGLKRFEPTPLPYWDLKMQTFIEPHVCIDRVTGTALEKMLYYQETVPAGVGFEVEIRGRFRPESHEKQVAFLLAALEGFNHPEVPILLGADTGSAKGRMEWELTGIDIFDKDQAKRWLSQSSPGHFSRCFRKIDQRERTHLLSISRCYWPKTEKNRLVIPITISFDSHFLINDPPGPSEMEKKQKEQDAEDPHMRPLLDERGKPALSGTAIKGALRSQAERILRTMAGVASSNKIACHPGGEDACPPVQDIAECKNLCLACKLFGGPGWKGPLHISRFECIDPGSEMTQEFLAIDRFTGGGAHGAKFNIRAFYRPRFKGTITLDLERMEMAEGEKKDPGWALGLLGLVLRDLKEGDITFGLGSSKGYGTCTAEIGLWNHPQFQEDVQKGVEGLRNIVKRPFKSKKDTKHE